MSILDLAVDEALDAAAERWRWHERRSGQVDAVTVLLAGWLIALLAWWALDRRQR